MQPNSDEHRVRPRPGERLLEQLWLKALAPGGRLPMPTIERIQCIRRLVAAWENELET